MTILITYPAFAHIPAKSFVFDYEMDTTLMTTKDILDTVFRQCNVADGMEWVSEKELRSMSVGDEILLIEGAHVEKYLVAGCGFTRLQ